MENHFLAIEGQSKSKCLAVHPAHHTFYRADPPEGCRLCEDASSEDIDLFSERRSDATLEEGDWSTILLVLMPGERILLSIGFGFSRL
ncbi:hypothetical protein J6590_032330 [Homalodisca vitripennis]|nr:hypothetical protein J6590_032330 [Homalodisca vitripennis]